HAAAPASKHPRLTLSVRRRRCRKAPRKLCLQGGAPSREAWIGHEILVSTERFLAAREGKSLPRTVALKSPALQILSQIGDHDLIEDLPVHRWVRYGEHCLYAPFQVARHHVGRTDIDMGLIRWQPAASSEAVDACMFKKAPDDAFGPDVFG